MNDQQPQKEKAPCKLTFDSEHFNSITSGYIASPHVTDEQVGPEKDTPKVLHPVLVQPGQLQMVQIQKPPVSEGKLCLLEALDEAEHPRLLVATTLHAYEGKTALVPIVNLSTEPVQICEGDTLVNAIEVTEEDILASQPTTAKRAKVMALLQNKVKSPESIKLLKDYLSHSPEIEEKDLKAKNVKVDGTNLTKGQRKQVLKLLQEFQDVFANSNLELGEANFAEHEIETGNHAPIKQQPHKTPFALRAERDKICAQMLEQGVTEPSQSPWVSPIVLVRKKDGTIRFCVDYRKLNDVTVKDAFPIPRVDETIETFRGANYFSTMDLQSGYWQIKMKEEDKPKTAFTTGKETYQFRRMPFGLTNAPATFQRGMQLLLSTLPANMCLAFIDDVIVYSSSFWDHVYDLALVLSVLQQANMKVKGKKCDFFCTQVTFLGFRVSAKGIEPCLDKIQKVKDTPAPRNQTEVRAFLGLSGFYRRFIQNYAKIVQPLTCLLKDDRRDSFEWGAEQNAAFNKLKDMLTEYPILGYPRYGQEFILYTDASTYALGAVLAQNDETGVERVIAYASRTLRGAELNYGVTEKECLAVIWALQHFRTYLLGVPVKVITDHTAATWIFSVRNSSSKLPPRLARWALQIQEYDVKVYYKKGTLHSNADALSRLPIAEADPAAFEKAENILRWIDHEETWYKDLQMSGEPPSEQFAQMKAASDQIPEWQTGPTIALADAPCDNPVLCPEQPWGIYKVLDDLTVTTQEEESPIDANEAINHPIEVPELADDVPPPLNPQDIKAHQRQQSPWRELIAYFETQSLPDDPDLAKEIVALMEPFYLDQGILCRNWKLRAKRTRKTGLEQVLVPTTLVPSLLKAYHDSKLAGHLSADKVYENIRLRYYWPTMYSDVKDYVSRCHKCQIHKEGPRGEEYIKEGNECSRPFQKVIMDIMGPLPKTQRGYEYVICFVDQLTRYLEAVPLKDRTALGIATVFVKEICLRYGVPEELLSDQEKSFKSELFLLTAKLMGTQKVFSAAYHPQTNGAVERVNKTLKGILAPYLNRTTNDWDECLPYAVFAYRQAVHFSTGYSPYYLLYGRDPMMPEDLWYQPKEPAVCPETYIESVKHRLGVAWHAAQDNARSRATSDKTRLDEKAHPQALKPGDLVALRWNYIIPGSSKKLSPKFRAPYRILEINWPNIQVTRIGDRPDKTYTYHMNSVKKYHSWSNEPPEDVKQDECRCGLCKHLYDPHEPNRRWIACDICDEWYHFECAGIKRVPNKEEPWYCQLCQAGTRQA